MKMMNIMTLVAGVLALCGCGDDTFEGSYVKPETPAIDKTAFVKGADVSWLTQMEKEGYTFKNTDGIEQECMSLLQDLGMNAIRLRVWVNPAEGWNSREDVLVKALRAKELGMRLMIDFHYSDTWADPGSQTIPAAWSSYDIEAMKQAVADHTVDVLSLLKEFDIEPEWVQVGNETTDGMLWELGRASRHPENYAALTTAGYDAVKSVFPEAQVIVHLDGGDRLGRYTNIFNILKDNSGKFDMIGMSLYPSTTDWRSVTDNCISNIKTLYDTYGKKLMICETGLEWNEEDTAYEFLSYLLSQTRENTGGACLGVFYWEPQAAPGYNGGYNKGAFDENGTPTKALDAFK